MHVSDNQDMRTCLRDPSHVYSNDLVSCPFCDLEPMAQEPLPPPTPIPSRPWTAESSSPAPSSQPQSGNIFSKKRHLKLLTRVKILMLLVSVITLGCGYVFFRSFHEFVFGWPLLHPAQFKPVPTISIIMFWLSLLSSLDKGEPEERRSTGIGYLSISVLLLPLLGLQLITPIAPYPGGIPEREDRKYILTYYRGQEDSPSYHYLSKEEYERLTRYYVRRQAFGWMIFHGILIVYLLFWHYKLSIGHLSPLKALSPHEMNIQQAILTLRADLHHTQTWSQLGWMLARLGYVEYANDCYQRALLLNLSNQPTAGALLPSWLYSSPTGQPVSKLRLKDDGIRLPSWFNEYQSGVSLFSLLHTVYLSKLVWFAALPIAVFLGVPLATSYPQDGAGSWLVTPLFLLLFVIILTLMAIRLLHEVLRMSTFYLSHDYWPVIEAMVMGSCLRLDHSNKKKYYYVHFAVVYKAGGRTFYSILPSLRDKPIERFESLQAARKFQNDPNHFGERVSVFYNPSQPNIIAQSRAGFHHPHPIWVPFMIMYFAFCVYCMSILLL